MEQYSILVKPLIQLAQQAGEVICKHYHSAESGAFEAKGDDTPLTRADLDSHDILLDGLQSIGRGIPVLSEESTTVTTEQRLSWQRYWLVDPLDGTREFLERTGEFTINIALIEQHKPVLGLLYQPLNHCAYVGIPGDKAVCYQLEPDGSWSQRALKTNALKEDQPLLVLASRRHRGPRIGACLDWLEQQWGSIERHNSGSAMKFCQMVEGRGDFYPRFSPCCEWDTGAGQALLEAAGGCLLGMDGQPVRYNCTESLYSPDFYAISDPAAIFGGAYLPLNSPSRWRSERSWAITSRRLSILSEPACMSNVPLSRLQFHRSASTCDEPALSRSGTTRMRVQLLQEIHALERQKEQLEQVDGKVDFCLQQTCREMIHSRRALYRQLAR